MILKKVGHCVEIKKGIRLAYLVIGSGGSNVGSVVSTESM